MTVERFGTHGLLYTLPVVIHGICRFTMLSMQARYNDPVVLLRDRPMIATVAIWIVPVVLPTAAGSHLTVKLGDAVGGPH